MRVRFAPSPTGALHIGGARTALFNWLLARGAGGRFVLRIEDTDRERSTPENVEQILDALRWLELDWDEGPIFQSASESRHREAVDALLDSGRAYRSRGDRRRRQGVEGATHGDDARLPRSDGGRTVRCACGCPTRATRAFDDLVLGEVRSPNRSLDDLVIARADGTPLYNLAVAVDDLDLEITARDPRQRPPDQHRQAAADHRARSAPSRRATATCRCCTAPTGKQALQAPRCSLGAGAARRGLPAGGGAQLPRAARLGRRRRRDDPLDRGAGRAASTSRACSATRPSSTSASCAGSTAATCARSSIARADRRARGLLRSHRPWARRSAISAEKLQTLADFWPLCGFIFDGPGRRSAVPRALART